MLVPGGLAKFLVITLAVAGCLTLARSYTVVLPPQQLGTDLLDPLPVVLTDEVGLVTSIRVSPDPPPVPGDGVLPSPDEPTVLVLHWMGGICDVKVAVSLRAVGAEYSLEIDTERRVGLCRLVGVRRAIFIDLSSPQSVEAFTVSKLN